MKITEAKSSDIKEIKSLIENVLSKQFSYKSISWEDFNVYKKIYIAKEENKLLGVIAIKKMSKETAKLKRMYVSIEKQNQGIGGQLLKKAITFCKKSKFKEIILTTYPEMKKAVNLYKKNRFKIVDNPEDYFFTNPKLRKYNKRQIAMRLNLK